MALLLAILRAAFDDLALDAGPRWFRATRLIGALAVATLVTLMIDRRLRR